MLADQVYSGRGVNFCLQRLLYENETSYVTAQTLKYSKYNTDESLYILTS